MPSPATPVKHRCPRCGKLRRDPARLRGARSRQGSARFPRWMVLDGQRVCGLCVHAAWVELRASASP